MLQDGCLTHIPAGMPRAPNPGRVPRLPLQVPASPGPHQLGWNRKAAASFTAVSDETQIPLEPEAYVNVWF